MMNIKMESSKTELKQVRQDNIIKPRKTDDFCENNLIMGIDRNILVIAVVLSISIGASYFLFKEVKKLKDEINTIKNEGTDDDLIEKVDQNSESVKAIETKLDQLIMALSTRDRMMNESKQQQMQQQMQQQVQQQMQQQVQQQVQQEQMHQKKDDIPVMGGRLGVSGSDITLV